MCDISTHTIPMYMQNTHTHTHTHTYSAKNVKVLPFVDVSISDFNKIHTHLYTQKTGKLSGMVAEEVERGLG